MFIENIFVESQNDNISALFFKLPVENGVYNK